MISKKILFWFVALLIPVMVIGMIEGSLRLAGVDAERSQTFVPVDKAGGYRAFNPVYPTRYFTSFTPAISFEPFAYPKPDDVLRIVAMGGSSTAGFPYSHYSAFPAQLRRRLQQQSFGQKIEVINLAMTAVNSFTLWDLADHVADLDPDAVIIYAGHNEYYGAFGAGSTQYGIGRAVWPKRVLLRLKDSVLFRFLESLIIGRPEPGEQVDPDGRTLMARVVRESGIPYNGEIFQSGLDQFGANLSAILSTFQSKSIPVFLGTLASNLADQPPLGDDPEAHAAFSRAREALAEGDTTRAKALFVEARDLDEIRFRAPSRMNALIRDLAAEHGAFIVDVEQAFALASPSGIPGAEIFDDHLHPNYHGYTLIADAFFDAIRSEVVLGGTNLAGFQTHYPQIDPIDRAQAQLQIARLKGGYPFRKELTTADEIAGFEAMLRSSRTSSPYDSLATLVVTKRLSPMDGLHRAVLAARARADTAAALAMSFGLIYWQPFNDELIDGLVGFASENSRFDQQNRLLAMEAFGRSDRTHPLNLLAAVTLRMGLLDDASVMLDEVERRDPSNRSMLFNKARLLVMQGDTLAARDYFTRYSSAD